MIYAESCRRIDHICLYALLQWVGTFKCKMHVMWLSAIPQPLQHGLANKVVWPPWQVAHNESMIERALAVQRELSSALRDVLKDGVVFVLPALPAVPPSM